MKHLFFALLALTAAPLVSAWSQKGHDVTAAIAEKHFTSATADSVSALLDGRSPVYWANWLDNASHNSDYSYTKTWHYKNIDSDIAYEDAPLNPKGDVVRAVYEMEEILSDPVSSRAQKVLALKILIHIVGDMHQPMHMGHLSDLGGNKVKVKFFGRDKNLHGIWDSDLPESAHKWSYTEWRDQIDRLTPKQEAAIIAGTPDDWARETFEIAGHVYNYFPEGTKASYNHIARWTPTIELQLERGGLRLAHLLNRIFDKEYSVNKR